MQYDKNSRSCWQLLIDRSFIMKTCPLMHHVLCRDFWRNIKSPRWLSPLPLSSDLVPCGFWLFPKLKSPLKGKRFQTTDKIRENITGQLMVIGRTVWGPKVPTLKGTEVSLSYVHCFLYLVPSSINVSIFHSLWLGTFWTAINDSTVLIGLPLIPTIMDVKRLKCRFSDFNSITFLPFTTFVTLYDWKLGPPILFISVIKVYRYMCVYTHSIL